MRVIDKSSDDILERFTSFSEVPDAVLSRFSHRSGRGLFSSIEWFSSLAECGFVDKPALQIFVCSEDRDNEHISYAIFLHEDVERNRLLGLSNYYTTHCPAIVCNGKPSINFADSLVDIIGRKHPGCSEVELRNLSISDRGTELLHAAFAKAGYHVDVFHQHWNCFINVDGLSYSEYLADRPARLCNTLARKWRQATSHHRIRLIDFREPDHLSAGMNDYQRVYERSWKRSEGSPNFVPELMRLCSELGVLRLGILYLDDGPAAAQFWIHSDRVSHIYKLAHDPRYDALSVGSLLTAHMFEQAIDVDKATEIDFGVGDEAYKRDWTNARRQLVGLQAINRRTPRGSLLSVRLSLRNALRRAKLLGYTPVQRDAGHAGEAGV